MALQELPTQETDSPFCIPPRKNVSRSSLPVAVIGAGISGLTAAWELKRQDVPVVILESHSNVGGVIDSFRDGEWLHEAGPNSLFVASKEIHEFLDSIDLHSRRLTASSCAKKRYIVRQGQPVALPSSPVDFCFNRVLSWKAKSAILREPFQPRGAEDADESVANFVTRRLGPEFLDYIVDPFVAGVYAGEPEKLSVRHAFPKLHSLEQNAGSLIVGALKKRNPAGAPRGEMLSFPDGLREIPRALAANLDFSLRLNSKVHSIRRKEMYWEICYETLGEWHKEHFSSVVCAVPFHSLSRLRLEGVTGAEHLRELRQVNEPTVVSVFTGYLRENVAHPLDGFGMLVPKVEERPILGTLFSSTLFPGRAPAGHVALTTFLGGARRPDLLALDDAELAEVVARELSAILGAKGAPTYLHVCRTHHAIPQYNVGYQQFKDVCTQLEAGAPGLIIGGNGRNGVSLASCIESGRKLAAGAKNAWSLRASKLGSAK